jgi:hypothetical protein
MLHIFASHVPSGVSSNFSSFLLLTGSSFNSSRVQGVLVLVPREIFPSGTLLHKFSSTFSLLIHVTRALQLLGPLRSVLLDCELFDKEGLTSSVDCEFQDSSPLQVPEELEELLAATPAHKIQWQCSQSGEFIVAAFSQESRTQLLFMRVVEEQMVLLKRQSISNQRVSYMTMDSGDKLRVVTESAAYSFQHAEEDWYPRYHGNFNRNNRYNSDSESSSDDDGSDSVSDEDNVPFHFAKALSHEYLADGTRLSSHRPCNGAKVITINGSEYDLSDSFHARDQVVIAGGLAFAVTRHGFFRVNPLGPKVAIGDGAFRFVSEAPALRVVDSTLVVAGGWARHGALIDPADGKVLLRMECPLVSPDARIKAIFPHFNKVGSIIVVTGEHSIVTVNLWPSPLHFSAKPLGSAHAAATLDWEDLRNDILLLPSHEAVDKLVSQPEVFHLLLPGVRSPFFRAFVSKFGAQGLRFLTSREILLDGRLEEVSLLAAALSAFHIAITAVCVLLLIFSKTPGSVTDSLHAK